MTTNTTSTAPRDTKRRNLIRDAQTLVTHPLSPNWRRWSLCLTKAGAGPRLDLLLRGKSSPVDAGAPLH